MVKGGAKSQKQFCILTFGNSQLTSMISISQPSRDPRDHQLDSIATPSHENSKSGGLKVSHLA